MSEKIYFKDVIKDKTYDELMRLIPCMVCREDLTNAFNKYQSYEVLGFGPDYVILGNYTTGYDEDAWFGSGEYTIDTYEILKFEDITQEYIFAHTLTEKQKEWYEKHNKESDCVSGYEAWHTIHDAVEQSRRNYNQSRSKFHENRDYDDDYHDDFFYL